MDVPPSDGQRSTAPVNIPKGNDEKEKDKKTPRGSWQSRSATSKSSLPRAEKNQVRVKRRGAAEKVSGAPGAGHSEQ